MKIAIIADSPALDLKQEYVSGFDIVICLDGAISHCEKIGIKANYLLGDLDTVKRIDFDLSSTEAIVIHDPDQNTTDLDKGLNFALSLDRYPKEVKLLNAVGGRMDHSLYNISALKRYSKSIPNLYIYNHDEIIRYVEDQEIQLSGPTGKKISIMPFVKASISTRGLKYDVQNYNIEVGYNSSTSNASSESISSISVNGSVLIIHDAALSMASEKQLYY